MGKIISKETKKELHAALDVKAEGYKIISLRATANELGIKQIDGQQCLGIGKSFCNRHPDYKMVRMMDNPVDSLFCSLTFIDKSAEFEEGY